MSVLGFLLAAGATLFAVSNSREANENARQANALNANTQDFIRPSIVRLNESSSLLSGTLRETKLLRESALVDFTESFVYYLQHINSNVARKPAFNDEIIRLQHAVNDYQANISQLASKQLDENAMLVSTAAGGLVAGAGALSAAALGTSMSLGLGLSFFGGGAFLISALQLSKSQNDLEQARYLNANRFSLKGDLESKTKAVDLINTLFAQYNDMLSDLIGEFGASLSEVRRIYKEGITSSKKNIKLIAKGKQPVFDFEDFSDDDKKVMFAAVGKCKVLTEFARARLLRNDGEVDYSEVKKIGLKA